MTIGLIGEFHAVPERPGMRTRALIATEHGFTSLFVAEFEMGQGASVPLHTHPIEEGFVVTDGALTIQLGMETITATPGSVVRIPPSLPHALRNFCFNYATTTEIYTLSLRDALPRGYQVS